MYCPRCGYELEIEDDKWDVINEKLRVYQIILTCKICKAKISIKDKQFSMGKGEIRIELW